MELIIASSNLHKCEEFRKILPEGISLLTLSDIGFRQEIDETGNSFEENAAIKAEFISERYKKNCFADDSGLVVDALNGAPGIYSARYAGTGAGDKKNLELLLNNMRNVGNRKAAFVCVIALSMQGNTYFFEGKINGIISDSPSGDSGFGYDPVFIPEGYNLTFAELKPEEKNKISHRAIAAKKLIEFLSALPV